jgi:hypothetical protein
VPDDRSHRARDETAIDQPIDHTPCRRDHDRRIDPDRERGDAERLDRIDTHTTRPCAPPVGGDDRLGLRILHDGLRIAARGVLASPARRLVERGSAVRSPRERLGGAVPARRAGLISIACFATGAQWHED